jgi:hypothetical protein
MRLESVVQAGGPEPGARRETPHTRSAQRDERDDLVAAVRAARELRALVDVEREDRGSGGCVAAASVSRDRDGLDGGRRRDAGRDLVGADVQERQLGRARRDERDARGRRPGRRAGACRHRERGDKRTLHAHAPRSEIRRRAGAAGYRPGG